MKKFFSVVIVVFVLVTGLNAQKNVGLDNWFNRETNSKTGQPYHYLWTDTAWSGFSHWGKIFTDKGAKISQIEKPVSSSLKNLNVYIIVDPDTIPESQNPNYVEKEDIKAVKKWVNSGGVLVLMTNDAKNCEFTHVNMLASVFGIQFNYVSLHKVPKGEWNKGAFTSFTDHPMFKGISKIYLKEISSLTLTGCAKPILTENGLSFMAESCYGKGRVIAIGDPWIYNEYIDHDRLPSDFQNHQAAENFADYLLKISR